MRLYEQQPIGTVPRARQLRRDASEPERRLLRALREAYRHVKWRHQAPVGPFFADILCFATRLIIEVDGDDHAAKIKQDDVRTRFLNAEGYTVIRFANADVLENSDGVVQAIGAAIAHKQKGRP